MAKKKIVAPQEPESQVSTGISDAVIAPPAEEAASEAAQEPSPEPLDKGEVIRNERDHTIRINGQVYHHVREALDGRWIYAPVKPRD